MLLSLLISAWGKLLQSLLQLWSGYSMNKSGFMNWIFLLWSKLWSLNSLLKHDITVQELEVKTGPKILRTLRFLMLVLFLFCPVTISWLSRRRKTSTTSWQRRTVKACPSLDLKKGVKNIFFIIKILKKQEIMLSLKVLFSCWSQSVTVYPEQKPLTLGNLI